LKKKKKILPTAEKRVNQGKFFFSVCGKIGGELVETRAKKVFV
jgi:hypothetical protein